MKRSRWMIPVLMAGRFNRFTASRLILLIGLVFFSGIINSCSKSQPPNDNRSGIVATIFPLYDLAKDIAGDDITTQLILPAGRSPHEYAMTPSDRVKLRNAKFLIMAGGGIDSWIVKAATDEEKRGLSIIDLYALEGGERLLAHEHEENESSDLNNQPLNPHQWLLPRVAEDMVKILTKTLTKEYPDKAQLLQSHLKTVLQHLDKIDNNYREQIRGIKDRRMITFHDAFDPLAQEYALDIVATIYRVESQQITPSDMTRLRHFINTGVRAVFAEPQFESGALSQLGDQLTIRTLDPLGGRTSPPGYATYDEMMESNLKILVEGLRDNQGN